MVARWFAFASGLALVGCPLVDDEGGNNNDTGSDNPIGDTGEPTTDGNPPPPQGCPTATPIRFEETVSGNTNDPGWDFDIATWADNSDVACYPSPQADQYGGPYQVYTVDMPPESEWNVILTPAPSADLSLVAWQEGPNETGCAPIREIGVVTCEAENDQGQGRDEVAFFNATTNPYRIVILVTAPSAISGGSFSLTVTADQ